MLIYFLRHADAMPDGERPLSSKGVKQSKRVGKALDELGVSVDRIYTSPLLRAKQTAEIVGESLGVQPEVTARLDSGADLDDVRGLLGDGGPDLKVMLVGHEPDFSTIVGALIGSGRVEMKKAGIALVECGKPVMRGGLLKWLAPPKRIG